MATFFSIISYTWCNRINYTNDPSYETVLNKLSIRYFFVNINEVEVGEKNQWKSSLVGCCFVVGESWRTKSQQPKLSFEKTTPDRLGN